VCLIADRLAVRLSWCSSAPASVGGPCDACCHSHGLAMTFHPTAVQSRERHGYYVGSRRGSTLDIAPDELACIHHDVGVRVNETNGNWERQR
jgi:hypothetical protein